MTHLGSIPCLPFTATRSLLPNQGRSLAQGLRGFLGLDEWSCFSELAFLPGISCKTKIDSDRNIKTGSQYFLGVDLLLNQSSPVPEVA
jgi:hypothetical protein